jgi:Mu-like prophage protein gp36
MKFLIKEDFNSVCDSNTLSVIDQADENNLTTAELYAIEEISSYLRSRYNVTEVFSQSGENRNSQIVMICCDVALYHLIAWLPKRIGFEIREIRYKRAIEWLESVQAAKASPDLPCLKDNKGEDILPIRNGSWDKNIYEY